MTPLPHADEPAAQISGHLWVVAAERGLAEGIQLRPRRVTMTAPRRRDRTARRRRADSSGSTSSCSPTRSKQTLALIVTHSRVELRGPALCQRSAVDGPTEAGRDGFEIGGAGFRSPASIGVVAGSNGDGPEREVPRELIERIASECRARACALRGNRGTRSTRAEVAERFRRIADA